MNNRTATTAAIILSLAAAGAPTATARPDFAPGANQPPPTVYSRPDKSMIAVSPPSTAVGAIAPASALQSLTPKERQRVVGISALSNTRLAAAFGAAPPVASKASAPQAVIRVHVPQSGFDWGDAGIGAAGGLALAMLGVGGGLVISRHRPRRTRRTAAVPN